MMIYDDSIIDGNILIAIFDGWYKDESVNKGTDINWLHPTQSIMEKGFPIPCTASSFRYHLDFNLLIPVIEKIGNLGLTVSLTWQAGYCIFNIHEYIYNCDYPHNVESDKAICSTWSTIVKFLKAYNLKKQS
jgi:hypothetical protein